MFIAFKGRQARRQSGASLIEVLISILILSFGMLAIGGMLSYAVQMPKLAGYRSSATSIAAGYVESMRANVEGFKNGQYASTSAEPHTFIEHWAVESYKDAPCSYPSCSSAPPTSSNINTLIGTADLNAAMTALRRELPGFAGLRVTCDGACGSMDRPEGDLWIIWSEPTTSAALDSGNSDECPSPASAPTFTAFTSPQPRCLHVRFKL
jgi:type IV pilus assembly protein PilV